MSADGSVIGAVISVEVKAKVEKNQAWSWESKRVRVMIAVADLIPRNRDEENGRLSLGPVRWFALERQPLRDGALIKRLHQTLSSD